MPTPALYWETDNSSNGVRSQPDRSIIQKNYFTKNASRVEIGENDVIITDYVGVVMFQLDTGNRTYLKVDLASIPSPGAEETKTGESVKVVPTDEVRTIAGYECRKYKLTFMEATSEYWIQRMSKAMPSSAPLQPTLPI